MNERRRRRNSIINGVFAKKGKPVLLFTEGNAKILWLHGKAIQTRLPQGINPKVFFQSYRNAKVFM